METHIYGFDGTEIASWGRDATDEGMEFEEEVEMHLYRFRYDGTYRHDICTVRSSPFANRVGIDASSSPDKYIGSFPESDIDTRARVGATVVCVLTEPDFQKAKALAVCAIEESIEQKVEDLERIRRHAKVLKETEE